MNLNPFKMFSNGKKKVELQQNPHYTKEDYDKARRKRDTGIAELKRLNARLDDQIQAEQTQG